MAAAELLKQGMSQSEVARRLGVHRQSVIRWARQLAQSPKVTDLPFQKLEDSGFRTAR
jgi:transposase